MARVGRFGRRRSGGQNLSALIASLIREQRAAEDRAIFDAYQNGGLFKGQKVTDQRILDYIKQRRDGFSKDDPLWDQWNNRLIQQQFSIGEQKIGLAFKQGKASAGAVAAFYRNELKKIPKDSEFYRTVAGRAADWARSAAASARAAGRARATAALQAKQDAAAQAFTDHNSLEAFLTQAAQRAGIIEGNQTLTDADATDLERLLSSGLSFKGKTVTMETWRDSALNAYRQFDTLIAINKQLNRGTKELTDNKQKWMSQYIVRINAIDDRSKYEMAREAYEQDIANAHGDPMTILEANKKYATVLSQIRQTALSAGGTAANDPQFIGGLQNEIEAVTTGKASGPTVTDLYRTHGEGVTSSDANDLSADAAAVMQDAQKLVAGTAYFGQDKAGGPLKVIDYPPQASLDPSGTGLPPGRVMSLVSINGVTRRVALQGAEVKSTLLVDQYGEPVRLSDFRTREQLQKALASGEVSYSKNQQTAGYVFTNPLNGETSYGVMQPNGTMVFTKQNPFTNLTTIPGEGGTGALSVLVGADAASTNANGDWQPTVGAGLLPLAVNGPGSITFNGQEIAATIGADSLLVDSTVTVADMERTLGNDPRYADFLANKRREVEQDKQNRLEDARFISNLRAGQGTVPRNVFESYNKLQQSPLGSIVAQASQGIGDLLKGLTLPGGPPTVTDAMRQRRFGEPTPPPSSLIPPPPPAPTGASALTSAESAGLTALQQQRQSAAEAQAQADASLKPGVIEGTNPYYVPPSNRNQQKKYL